MLFGFIQLLCSQRRGKRGWGSCQCKPKYLVPIKYPVHKLLGIVTRFLVSFIKVPVLFKIFILKKLFPFLFEIANRLSLPRTIT